MSHADETIAQEMRDYMAFGIEGAPDYADEHECGQLRLGVPGEQVSLLPLPDSLIPVVRCKDVAALLGDPLAEITPAAMETLRLRGQVKMTDPDSLR